MSLDRTRQRPGTAVLRTWAHALEAALSSFARAMNIVFSVYWGGAKPGREACDERMTSGVVGADRLSVPPRVIGYRRQDRATPTVRGLRGVVAKASGRRNGSPKAKVLATTSKGLSMKAVIRQL